MRDFSETDVPDDVLPPVMCPVCRSTDLTTTSKTVTSSSYWRCLKCGEIWNAKRLEEGARYWRRPR